MMTVRNLASRLALIALGACTMSCGEDSVPTAPSATAVSAVTSPLLEPDGVISLKTPPPVLDSPVNNAETEDLQPVLTTANSQPRYLDSADFTYEFEVYDGAMTRVRHTNGVAQTPNTTSYTVTPALEQTTPYMWRARAEIGDEKGPWSDPATFRTPTLLGVPTPLMPADGAVIEGVRPMFVLQNGDVPTGSGPVTYQIQVDDDGAAFPSPMILNLPRAAGTQTTGEFPDPLAPNTLYSLRSQATDGTVTSD